VTREQILMAWHNAITWLEANRDRHITGTLAKDSNGYSCKPNDPDAQCFCALGRMSKELNISDYPGDEIAKVLGIKSQDKVYELNDAWDGPMSKVCPNTPTARRNVVTYLKKKLVEVTS
jgi:hypothetical protein